MDFNPLAAGLTAPFFATYLYTILSSFDVLSSVWQKADILGDKGIHSEDHTQHYDFIIVGAGSAGGLVAHRLSKEYNVLLLEAGGEPNPLSRIPGLMGHLINYPELDWNHRTVPQKYACLGAKNQQCSFNAGLGLGGTGNLNAMVHMRGHSLDFDLWGNLTEDPSWNFDGVLPFFKSYEHFAVENDSKVDMNYHGVGGTVQIERPDFPRTATDAFITATKELGYPNVDLNGARFGEGFDYITYSSKRGVRQVSFAAFIEPARREQGLIVKKFSLVTKIILENKHAKGVEYIRHGKTYKAFAINEVIISGGTFGSPRILMLSGIGPKEHLKEIGIPVVEDLPVGKRFMDHVATRVGPFYLNSPSIPAPNADDFNQWMTSGTGVLATPGVRGTGLTVSSFAKARGEATWPDIQFFLGNGPAYANGLESWARAAELKLDELKRYFENPEGKGKNSFMVAVSLARPRNQGYLQLGGSSIYDKLIIDPNYLNPNDNNGVDQKVVLEGVKLALKMVENTTVFNNLGAKLTTNLMPGCENLVFRSDDYWKCYISRFTTTLHHFCGTCAFGKSGDKNAVVDTKLKVQGIQGLRVVDGSVMPAMVASNSQAPILMIAEKASNMILNEWKMKTKREL